MNTGALSDLLLGRRVKKIAEDELQLDDGTVLKIVPNEGCGGCGNGWYQLEELNEVDNIITAVELKVTPESDGAYEGKHTYAVFVVAEARQHNLFTVKGDDGNGHYGTGFRIIVKEKG